MNKKEKGKHLSLSHIHAVFSLVDTEFNLPRQPCQEPRGISCAVHPIMLEPNVCTMQENSDKTRRFLDSVVAWFCKVVIPSLPALDLWHDVYNIWYVFYLQTRGPELQPQTSLSYVGRTQALSRQYSTISFIKCIIQLCIGRSMDMTDS